MAIKTAREMALQVLQEVFSGGAYANLALSKYLKENNLPPVERRFATELVYGVVKASGTLDWMISHYVKRSLNQTDPLVVNILRLGLYQLRFLDKIPPSAAVNEAVNLARKLAHPGANGFVNAVLRSALREPEKIRYPNLTKDPVKHIALKEYHPEWLVKKWISKIGMEETLALCRFNNTQPPLSLRTNTLRIVREELLDKMLQTEVEATLSTLAPEGILCRRLNGDPMLFLREGLCQAQDESSMLVSHVLSPQAGEFIIDACAAPGGKATHIAALMRNQGRVLACDIHEHKMNLINENSKRLGIDIVETSMRDSTTLHQDFSEKADRVLVDAPCSGLGVLRRRPDARWRKDEGMRDLPDLQKSILMSAARCVKPGGILVYSTCTLEESENEAVVKELLESGIGFTLESAGEHLPVPRPESLLTFWPQRDNIDGFFIARLRRIS